MSKELVISSTPHETRVTLLEDGQLCEIYIEREKEYALVGSIYKGRVTRVLPGMQSAFVDIGLDTDAFLYVSDVLEDIDEYEQIISTVEGKVERMEQQGGEVFGSPATAPAAALPPSEGPSAVAAPGKESPAREAISGELRAPKAPSDSFRGPHRRPESRGFGRGRDRQGRYPRRGGRSGDRRHGRELPPSKYASPTEEIEPVILPGESLAKYKNRVPQVTAPPAGPSLEEPQSATPAAESQPPTLSEPRPEPLTPQGTSWTPAQELPTEINAAGAIETRIPAAPFDQQAIASAPEVSELRAPEQLAEGITPAPDVEPPLNTTASGEPELTGEEATALAEQLAEAQKEEIEAEAAESEAAEENQAEAAEGFLETAEAMHPGEEAETAGAPEAAAEGTEPAVTEVSPPAEPQQVTARVDEDSRARFQRPMPRHGRHRGGYRARSRERHFGQRRPQLISELLKPGQEVSVQIAKEPLGRKGARITSHIALPGRFLVYMPTLDHVGVSRKINSADERTRLRRLVSELKGSSPGGFIVRTAAEGTSEADIRTDVEFLTRAWTEIRGKAEQRKAPALLHRDLDLVERILRDYLSSDYAAIWVDTEDQYTRVLDFVSRFQPELVSRVKLYTKETPIFEEMGIQQDIDKSLRPKVWLKSGGYIVINHTEALVAIDVNTGKFVGRGSVRLEDTIVRTNLEAVKEIVRQIRLRDLGGIIVIDFIDMEERKNREKVLQALEDALRADRAPSKTLAFNEFGLVAITRKRTKQALERVLCQPCPYCTGSGMVKSIPTICYEIQAEARKMALEIDSPSLTLRVHPEIAKALKTRESVLVEELERITHKNILIQSDPTLHWEQYDIY